MQKFVRSVCTVLGGIFLVGTTAANAVTFPADNSWIAAQAGGNVITDVGGDVNVGQPALDIVGDASHPAAYFFSDGANLFFRERISADPSAQTFGYGVQISTDGNNQNYEYMVVVDKSAGVELWKNNLSSNSTGDVAETMLSSSSNATNVHISLDGNGHYFIDFAVSLADFGTNLSVSQFIFGTNSNGAPSLPCGTSSDIAGQNGCGTTLWSSLASDSYTIAEAGTTPLPAALPLLASGLGALGLLGWRRRRKDAAIAA